MKAEMARDLPSIDAAGYWSSIGTSEQMEAFSAFLDKRSPDWPVDGDRGAFVEAVRRPGWMTGSTTQGDDLT
jgi:hypothetical protein